MGADCFIYAWGFAGVVCFCLVISPVVAGLVCLWCRGGFFVKVVEGVGDGLDVVDETEGESCVCGVDFTGEGIRRDGAVGGYEGMEGLCELIAEVGVVGDVVV